jgi:ubiquinone/menaquinone biosynthesis C-methylase UbiE
MVKMWPQHSSGSRLPFGVPELLAAVGEAETVLDLGCGSGRLTVALALAGAEATGVDTNAGRLADARKRAEKEGAAAAFLAADMNAPLPFADGAFGGVTSRLALMIARDPVATLREAARVLTPAATVATAVWARIEANPWFGEPRAAVAAALGPERAAFAGAFGRLGDAGELAELHRLAGFADVDATVLRDEVTAADAAAHWESLTASIGHYRRLDADLTPAQRDRLQAELARRLEPLRRDGELRLGRAMVIVRGRR